MHLNHEDEVTTDDALPSSMEQQSEQVETVRVHHCHTKLISIQSV